MAKPIVITDDAVVNEYGFRVLTDGGDLTLFQKNPIMLYDHARSDDEKDKDVILPIGTWKDLQRAGTALVATPDFDVEDEFAAEIGRKYEKGIFNMASIGFRALEWSEDPALMLPGQMLPTVTKWVLREASICDIGANYSCTKVLNSNGGVLQLNAKTSPEDIKNFFNSNKLNNPTMKKVIATLNGSKLVSLNETSSEELVAEGVTTLIGQLSSKDQIIAQKDAEIVALKGAATAAAEKGLKDRGLALIEGALAAKKIVPAQKDNLVKLASASEESYASTKQYIDSITGYAPVSGQLEQTLSSSKTTIELKKEYEEHLKHDTLSALRNENPEHFKAVYKAGTGKEFKNA